MSRRTERIAEQLREEIARLLRERVSDPRLRMVTVTRVDVASDLSNATVHWSALHTQAGDADAVAEGLAGAAGFLRHRLASELELRRTPALTFRHDPSLELGSQTLSVLNAIDDGQKT